MCFDNKKARKPMSDKEILVKALNYAITDVFSDTWTAEDKRGLESYYETPKQVINALKKGRLFIYVMDSYMGLSNEKLLIEIKDLTNWYSHLMKMGRDGERVEN